jgi:hypothetical protein
MMVKLDEMQTFPNMATDVTRKGSKDERKVMQSKPRPQLKRTNGLE